jgi:hypothetical protein
VVLLGDDEPSFSLGDGIDQWAYLSGVSNETLRSEILLETHSLGSRSGNGNALISGDWKILLRTASLWPYATNIGSNDGWFGGPNSSDPGLGAYALPVGAQTQPYTVQCPSPPADFTSSFQCANKAGVQLDDISYACLFNLADDPCEQVDVSLERPDMLQVMWNRLSDYRQGVYEYPCTRCKEIPSCPQVEAVSAECPGSWYEGAQNCLVNMPC